MFQKNYAEVCPAKKKSSTKETRKKFSQIHEANGVGGDLQSLQEEVVNGGKQVIIKRQVEKHPLGFPVKIHW